MTTCFLNFCLSRNKMLSDILSRQNCQWCPISQHYPLHRRVHRSISASWIIQLSLDVPLFELLQDTNREWYLWGPMCPQGKGYFCMPSHNNLDWAHHQRPTSTTCQPKNHMHHIIFEFQRSQQQLSSRSSYSALYIIWRI